VTDHFDDMSEDAMRTLLRAASCFRLGPHPALAEHPMHWVEVQWRGGDRWAVVCAGEVLGQNGAFEYEPFPSSRTEHWTATHRFSISGALARAREIVNGSITGYESKEPISTEMLSDEGNDR
jgi:hypothetical protein